MLRQHLAGMLQGLEGAFKEAFARLHEEGRHEAILRIDPVSVADAAVENAADLAGRDGAGGYSAGEPSQGMPSKRRLRGLAPGAVCFLGPTRELSKG